jgi:hypothetical protein
VPWRRRRWMRCTCVTPNRSFRRQSRYRGATVKLSRRELTLGAAVAALAPKVSAQTAPAASDATQQARDAWQRNSEILAKFEIPMATEPAFQFKP